MSKLFANTIFSLGIFAIVLALVGCNNVVAWREEVKLADGRTIIVAQKRRLERVYNGHDVGHVVREVQISINLPEVSPEIIIWRENLTPLVLNYFDSTLYIVGLPPTGQAQMEYGNPSPMYVGFKFQAGHWQRIPFNQIPVQIYECNMSLTYFPQRDTAYVSLADKTIERSNPQFVGALKRLDPSFKPH